MKKKIFTAVLFAMAFANAALWAQSMDKIEQAAQKFNEGDYYAYQFQQYKSRLIAQVEQQEAAVKQQNSGYSNRPPITRTPVTATQSGGGAIASVTSSSSSSSKSSKSDPTTISRNYGASIARPDGIQATTSSEQDIDRAIAAYEASLGIIPSGTWKLSKKDYKSELLPPEGGVKARLAEAQKRKEQWLATGKLPLEQRLAAAQAELSRPMQDNDFGVRQNSDNTITITGFNASGVGRNVVIPEKLYGLPVTAIANDVFKGKVINSVVIPDTVTTIGNSAFYDSSLTSVVIGKGVKTIGQSAFGKNPKLTEIIIPDSVTTIGGDAFSECGLTSLTLGNALQTIGDNVFAKNKLTNVTISGNVTAIGNNAFSDNSLTEVTLPAGLQTIGSWAFANNQLTEVILPAGLTSIGEGAFGNNQLTEVILPAGLTSIGEWAFNGNGNRNRIQSVSIPAGIKTVRRNIFRDTTTRITLPANVSDSDLTNYGFEANFRAFYESQGRTAGTYEKNGPIWARSRAGGID